MLPKISFSKLSAPSKGTLVVFADDALNVGPTASAVLSGADRRFAEALIAQARRTGDLVVGDNEPYRIDAEDYGIPEHALARGLPNALLEIRQDLLSAHGAASDWAERLAGLLENALQAQETGRDQK